MSRYVVDTHALIWFLAQNPNLGSVARAALNDPGSELVLPAIALAEVLWIISSRELGLAVGDVLAALDADPRVLIYPLTREVVETANGLTTIGEMHDRQIAATALCLSSVSSPYVLLTKDKNIAESGVVRIAW